MILIGIAFVFVAFAAWSTRQLHAERKSLAEQRRVLFETALQNANAASAQRASVVDLEARFCSLTKSLAVETAATAAAASRARELAKNTSIDPADVTASFGKINQMAAVFGEALRALYSSVKANPEQPSPEEGPFHEVAGRLVQFAPAVRALEDEPAEIAHLQTAILRDVFSLDASQSAKVEDLLARDFATLKDEGYSASQKPDGTDADNAWLTSREKLIGQFVEQLKPLLPESDREKLGLAPIILNLGSGFQVQASTAQDGWGTLTFGIPGFSIAVPVEPPSAH